MSNHKIILVNECDEAIGEMDKLVVHQQGLLHRAFSVFLFDKAGNMMLQQRAAKKYHGALLWTNACCSHPFPAEDIVDAAHRRLWEELGIQTEIEKIFVFTYNSPVENNLIEHEIDHVFAGEYEGEFDINDDEVADYAYYNMKSLKLQLKESPDLFTIWFRLAFPRVEKWWSKKYLSAKAIEA